MAVCVSANLQLRPWIPDQVEDDKGCLIYANFKPRRHHLPVRVMPA